MKWRSSDEASNLDSCLDKVPVDDSQERVLNRERNFPLYVGRLTYVEYVYILTLLAGSLFLVRVHVQ